MPYRAIVFVNLDGGNDSFNMVIPTGPGYPLYATTRGPALVIPENQIQALPFGGVGLHPNLAPVASRASRLAVIANSGTLIRPLTKQEYLSGLLPIPPQLFSHNDQSRLWQSPASNAAFDASGWGAEIASAVVSQNDIPLLTSISFAGSTKMVSGGYSMNQNGAVDIYGNFGGDGARRKTTLQALVALPPVSPLDAPIVDVMGEAIEIAGQVNTALAGAPSFSSFPGSLLGQQMRTVARMISRRVVFGMDRQVFFVRQGNFDTHEDAGRLRHNSLMLTLGQALAAFDDAMQAEAADVTVLIYSEFGRTLRGNGNGSDHGWGGNQLVLGGPVISGLYGTFPNLTLGGPDDIGLGRILPTTSHDQIGSTMAQWMGAPTTIFPNIGNFATNNLGFLS